MLGTGLPTGFRAYAKLPRREVDRDTVQRAVEVRRELLSRLPCTACLPHKPCRDCLSTVPRELQQQLPLEGELDLVSLHAHLLMVGWLDADEETWLAAECRLLQARLLPWTDAQYRSVLPMRLPWRWVPSLGKRHLRVHGGQVQLPAVPPPVHKSMTRPEKRERKKAIAATTELRLGVLRDALVAKMCEMLRAKLRQLRQLRTTGTGLGQRGLLGLSTSSPMELLRWSGFRAQCCPTCGRLAPGQCCSGVLVRHTATEVLQKLRQGLQEGWVTWQSGGLLGGTFRLLHQRRLRWPRIVQALRPLGFHLEPKHRTGTHSRWTLDSCPTDDGEQQAQRMWQHRLVAAVHGLCPITRPLERAVQVRAPELAPAQRAMTQHGMGDNVLQVQSVRILCTHAKGMPRFCALKRGLHRGNNGYLFVRNQSLVYRCHAAGCRGREVVVAPFFQTPLEQAPHHHVELGRRSGCHGTGRL